MGLFTRWQLSSRDPAVRIRAAAALGSSGKPAAVGPLTGLLADPDAGVRQAAVEALGALGDPGAVEPISRLMQTEPASRDDAATPVRAAAARALGRLGGASIPALAGAIHDRHPKVREAAVEALGVIGGPQVVPALAVALRDDRSQLRQAAAKALAVIGGDEARNTLLTVLNHKDPATRATVVQALADLGDMRSVSELAAALRDREKAVRERTVAALGRLGSGEAAEALLGAFEGPDRDVRQAAATELRRLAWSPSTPRQRALHAVLRGDFDAALAEGQAAVEPLLIALQEKDGHVRRRAAEALGATGDPRAVGHLVDALADHDDQTRSSAAQALIRIGPAAVPAVVDALGAKSGPVRAAAAAILAGIGEGRAIAPLVAAIATRQLGSTATVRRVVVRHGVKVALLDPGEDIVRVRSSVDTLRTLLGHAAARIPLPDLERLAGLNDLVEPPQRDARGGHATGAPEEVSCADMRELARQELARRGRTVTLSG